MPTVKGFFKKLGSDTKKFFSKGGAADTGLRKLGNTVSQVGGVAQKLAPLAAVVAPEFAVPLMAGGALAKVAGSTALAARKGAMKGRSAEDKTAGVVGALTSGIEAGKPSTGQLEPLFA
jgi:hypothetical protein